MGSDSKSVLPPSKQRQGQERRQKSCLTTKDAMESVRASSNRQPVCPSRISRDSHKSVSLNAFDTPSVPAFVRSVRQRSWVVSHPRFWKFWIFKNIFENTNFFRWFSSMFLEIKIFYHVQTQELDFPHQKKGFGSYRILDLVRTFGIPIFKGSPL